MCVLIRVCSFMKIALVLRFIKMFHYDLIISRQNYTMTIIIHLTYLEWLQHVYNFNTPHEVNNIVYIWFAFTRGRCRFPQNTSFIPNFEPIKVFKSISCYLLYCFCKVICIFMVKDKEHFPYRMKITGPKCLFNWISEIVIGSLGVSAFINLKPI